LKKRQKAINVALKELKKFDARYTADVVKVYKDAVLDSDGLQ
jgi:hypothetical protein